MAVITALENYIAGDFPCDPRPRSSVKVKPYNFQRWVIKFCYTFLFNIITCLINLLHPQAKPRDLDNKERTSLIMCDNRFITFAAANSLIFPLFSRSSVFEIFARVCTC